MQVKKTQVLVLFLIPMFFGSSYWLISAYTEGDQNAYKRFYEELTHATPAEVMPLARRHVSGGEPISAFVLWAGATTGIEKDVFITLLNVLLLTGLFLVCRRLRVEPVPLFFIFTNFYLLVLLTSAERLKIAYIMLVWAVVFGNRASKLLVGLSVFAHMQNLLLMPSLLLGQASNSIKSLVFELRIPKMTLFAGIFVLALGLLVYFILFEEALRKGSGYAVPDNSVLELVNLTFLSIASVAATKDRWRMILTLVPFYPAAFILGGMRVNMIAVSIVIFLLAKERVLKNPLILGVLLYLSIKSVPYVLNIVNYGNGFA